MVHHVVSHERLDEPVAVVIARLHPQGQVLARGGSGLLECGRLQLHGQELVGVALVHEDRPGIGAAPQQRRRIPLIPRRPVRAEIAGERLLAPGHRRRVADGRKRRHRLPARRVAQRRHQRAVPAHRVPKHAAAVRVHRELRLDQRRQFPVHVLRHVVVPGPRRLRCVQVEPGSQAEVPRLRLPRKVQAARAGVGHDQHQPVLGGQAQGAGLLREGFLRAGQAGEVVQRRARGAGSLRRNIDAEAHRGAGGLRRVGVEAYRAVKARLPAADLHRSIGHPETTSLNCITGFPLVKFGMSEKISFPCRPAAAVKASGSPKVSRAMVV